MSCAVEKRWVQFDGIARTDPEAPRSHRARGTTLSRAQAGAPRADSTAVSMARIVGAVSLFVYHYVNDVGLLSGIEYRSTGPLGLLGYFGVAVFIVISGAVLGGSFDRSSTYAKFIGRRLKAIFSLFWWVAIPLIALSLVSGRMAGSDLPHVPFWLLGLNVLRPETFRPLVDAWWYIGLAVQVILVYPLLHRLMSKVGDVRSLLVASGVVLLSTAAVRLLPSDWAYLLDGFVGARLLELTFGVAIGRTLRGEVPAPGLASAMPTYFVAAMAVSVVLPEMALRVGAGMVASVLLLFLLGLEYSMSARSMPIPARIVGVLAGVTYPFFLVHPPIVRLAVERVDPDCVMCTIALIPVVLAAGILAAWALRASHDRASGTVRRAVARHSVTPRDPIQRMTD